MAEIIAITNQKGGVGKTTTAINLAAALSLLGQETLLIDLDPQANATSGMGFDKKTIKPTIYPVLLEEVPLEAAIKPSKMEWLDMVPSNRDLVGAEIELVGVLARESRLKTALEPINGLYRFILIDCPPSLGLLTINALAAANKVLIPIQSEYYALEGLAHLSETIRKIKSALNPGLEMEGGILTMFDARISLANQVKSEVDKFFKGSAFPFSIPRNVRLAEAPSFGQPIFIYDPRSRGGEAYMELAISMLSKRSGQDLSGMKNRLFAFSRETFS